MTTPAATDTTVGVALPIPDPWGRQLQQARLGFGETRAANIPTHITLLPPTPATGEEVAELQEHLAQVAAAFPPFPVVLRGTGTFRPVSDVVYVQVAQGVSSCEQLESAVRAGPVRRQLAFPYHPHVTIGHDLPPDALDRAFTELAGFNCDFLAGHVAMYVHHGDEVWRPVARFDLTGDPAAFEHLPG